MSTPSLRIASASCGALHVAASTKRSNARATRARSAAAIVGAGGIADDLEVTPVVRLEQSGGEERGRVGVEVRGEIADAQARSGQQPRARLRERAVRARPRLRGALLQRARLGAGEEREG
jgi:hypothetical protein